MITILAIVVLPTYLILNRVWDTFDNYLRCKCEERLRKHHNKIGFINDNGERHENNPPH